MKHPSRRGSVTLTLLALLLAACAAPSGPEPAVELQHIHGLAYSPDGNQLIAAAHDGLRIFADGRWQVPDLPRHDYMGYSATDAGFYSSGHPAPSAQRPNPLGLIRSEDAGKTFTPLAFEGESDFHVMAAGYYNHAIYVVNPAPNSQLPVGLHYSLDDGATWQQSLAAGITAGPIQLAVHPTRAEVVALATENGLFLSSDHGNSFMAVGGTDTVTAVAFEPAGERLFFGSDSLSVYDLGTEQVQALETPGGTTENVITAIAVNPVRRDEIVYGTVRRDVFVSQDGGGSWVQIAREGVGTG
jgi:WD40 repeat protein